MSKPYPSDEFGAYYNSTVKPIAHKCAEHFKLIMKIENGETPTSEDEAVLKTIHDPIAVFYVGHMVGDVERALVAGTNLNLINSLGQVQGVLAKDSTYWKNVWNNDFSSEEAKALVKLGEEVSILIGKM